jgi:hypothetical protein
MSRTVTALLASGLVTAGLVAMQAAASAAPAVNQQALKNAVQETAAPNANVESVRWYGHRGHWGGRGRGWGYGGFAAGAIIGGALASRYYYPPPYYGPTYYYPPAPPPPVYYGGDDVGYCMSRFRSYDPRSGTYLGYDGRRHPCP